MRTLFFLLTFYIGIYTVNAQDDTATTYFLIRHAEKAKDGTKNPHLTQEGKLRAQHWSEVLKKHNINMLFSTDYHRTKETIEPYAKANNLPVHLYQPATFDVKEFMDKTKGKTVLIAGHSNTTPVLVNVLIQKDKYKELHEDEYGTLFIVIVDGSKAYDIRLSDL